MTGTLSQKRKEKEKRKGSPTSSGEKEKKKRKRKRATGSARDKDRSEEKEGPRKGKRQKRSSIDESKETDSEEDALFGGKGRDDSGGRRRGESDRGPFGGGDVVKFKEATDSDSESLRGAPADQKATTQLR